MLSTFLWAQPGDSTYATPGSHTYTIPTGYTATLQIEVWGAGGGGGTDAAVAKGGGGGGAYASSTLVLTAGTYNLTVGLGGQNGSAGTPSDFNDLIVAAAGGGSTADLTGGLGGSALSSIGDITFSGGNGGAGYSDNGGGGGEAAGPEGNGMDGATATGIYSGAGGAGNTSGGDGGIGSQRIDNIPAGDGAAPGGGGGGKHGPGNNNNSGIGGDGMVVVTVIDYALPISLLSFDGYAQNHNIQLEWSTATEVNNDFMAIERSVDGLHFDEIGRVSGHGTSFETNHYQFTDVKPVNGLNYYRLRQVDIDGVSTVHKIISIQMNDAAKFGELVIYPNPVQERLHLQWEVNNAPSEIKIFDLSGKELRRNQINEGTSEYLLPVGDLPAGLYVLHAIRATSSEVIRLQKQ